ncbi:hypothetical protein HUJ04_011459 [Dendroctonus ponderosae]|nr:hypothetical protein HUJ04_011459 [Dendroctonus ponderosae]KAH1021980.1 hypothetical protein HUJ04_011459 [Dendroctonus ponderosae]KAH1021981.1 hypothetical protein HUJ04_011459 [Dendroctonus ponderosae]KAH1021982.1 hypothetical protein HUJ04_011459 [Dendroctonus ponderosae]
MSRQLSLWLHIRHHHQQELGERQHIAKNLQLFRYVGASFGSNSPGIYQRRSNNASSDSSGSSRGFKWSHLGWLGFEPHGSGTLMGLTNGSSHISAISAPLIVQMVVTDESDPHQWKLIFWLTAGILTAVAVVFNIFGTAEKQDWNEAASEENGKSLSGCVLDLQ